MFTELTYNFVYAHIWVLKISLRYQILHQTLHMIPDPPHIKIMMKFMIK